MSTTEPIDDEYEFGSWDAFWDERLRAEQAERGAAPTTTIRGVEIRIPADLPLNFEAKLHRAEHASDEATFKQLLTDLFGADVLDAWIANGMGEREFKVVMSWGIACGRGRPISFQQAYERVRAREQEAAAGKAPTATISTPSSDESDATGGRSKPTSTASTASTRKRSRSSRGASSGNASATSPPTASTS